METLTTGPTQCRDHQTGQFAATFTLTYETRKNGREVKIERRLPASGVEYVGKVIAHRADRGEAWNIAVWDAAGAEVTFDFACFQS